jgi:hypothetical protein
MLKSILHGISALGAFGPRADKGPLGLICHAIWILACIFLYILRWNIITEKTPNKELHQHLGTHSSILQTMYPMMLARVTKMLYMYMWKREQLREYRILINVYNIKRQISARKIILTHFNWWITLCNFFIAIQFCSVMQYTNIHVYWYVDHWKPIYVFFWPKHDRFGLHF